MEADQFSKFINENNIALDPLTQEFVDTGLKQGSQVVIGEEVVVKPSTLNEVATYGILEKYQDQLLSSLPSIITPLIVASNSEFMAIGRLPEIKPTSVDEHFGWGADFTQEQIETLVSGLQQLREIIPVSEVGNQDDPEENLEGILAFLSNRNDKSEVIEAGLEHQYDALQELYLQSQSVICTSPAYFSHKDVVRGNLAIGRNSMSLIDWETCGRARVGYDEGRFTVQLCMEPTQQELVSRVMEERYEDSTETLLSYWRTVASRSYKELTFALTGKYDERIARKFIEESVQASFKDDLTASLKNSLGWSLGKFKSKVNQI